MRVNFQSLTVAHSSQPQIGPQSTATAGAQQVAATGLSGLFGNDSFANPLQQQAQPPTGPLSDIAAPAMQKILGLLKRLIEMVKQLMQQQQSGGQQAPAHRPAGGGGHGAAPAQGSGGAGAAQGSETNGSVPKGFLWKPVSESNGKCVVLLPSNMTGKVAGVSVKGPNGETLESGRYSSVANGGREHYRLGKPGSAYPPGSSVEIRMKDGTTQSVKIPNPSKRVE